MLDGSGVQLGAYSLYAQRVNSDNVEENNTDEYIYNIEALFQKLQCACDGKIFPKILRCRYF